jgi:hypothetical protein
VLPSFVPFAFWHFGADTVHSPFRRRDGVKLGAESYDSRVILAGLGVRFVQIDVYMMRLAAPDNAKEPYIGESSPKWARDILEWRIIELIQ